MTVVKREATTPETIAPGRTRYLSHSDNLMMVVIDFTDGPATEPDPPHWHPHEQVTYVAAGEVLFFIDGEPTHLTVGDMITVPSNAPHTIQLLTDYVRLVDTFTPLREDFLNLLSRSPLKCTRLHLESSCFQRRLRSKSAFHHPCPNPSR